MKAIVSKKSGPPSVLKLEDMPKPAPKQNEILVKISASTVTRGDVFLRKLPRFVQLPMGLLFGFKVMEITGVEFAGEVEKVGSLVTIFKDGDHVFGTTTGLKYGGNAEYVCVPEERKSGVVIKKPDSISFNEAAAIPVGAMTALHLLRKGEVTIGHKILIYGASGSVGTYAVQLAKYFGAEVTGICSTKNVDLVKSLGTDNVIDYTKTDFTQMEHSYDIIFDAVGKISKSKCKNILRENGTYLTIKSPTKEKTEYMQFLCKLIEKQHIKPVIDKYYTLAEVAEAHLYVESGHKKGNVVIQINQ